MKDTSPESRRAEDDDEVLMYSSNVQISRHPSTDNYNTQYNGLAREQQGSKIYFRNIPCVSCPNIYIF